MRHHDRLITVLTVLALAAALVSPALAASPSQCQTYEACFGIGVLAYVYGYPLVIMGVSQQVATNVKNATSAQGRAPINQFSNNPLPDATYIDVVLPSVSTPYSNAFLDLTKEPIVLSLPDLGNRFFLMQVIDAWTNVGGEDPGCLTGADGFCGLGSRYSTKAGHYAFVGPGWKGTMPAGITQVIQMPTNMTLIAGRTLTDGSQADMAIVSTIQQQYTLTPLSKFGKSYKPPTHSPIDPSVDMATGPRDQVTNMSAAAFFKMLADLMRANPPQAVDTEALALIAKLGIEPGKPFEINRLSPTARQALEDAYVRAQEIVVQESQNLNFTTTNWSMSLDLGVYGRRYLERAAIAYGALGANLYLDAVYAGALKDGDGNPLHGDKKYTLHFAKDQFPPSDPKAFWSVTLYNRPEENLYASPNGINALGIPPAQGHSVCLNGDESLTFYIQSTPPSSDTTSVEYCNWLPSPPGKNFLLLLRMYWPGEDLFKHIHPWIPPAVQLVP